MSIEEYLSGLLVICAIVGLTLITLLVIFLGVHIVLTIMGI